MTGKDQKERRSIPVELQQLNDKLDQHIEMYLVERSQDRASVQGIKDTLSEARDCMAEVKKSMRDLNEKIQEPLDLYSDTMATTRSIKKVSKTVMFIAVLVTSVSAAWYAISHFGHPPKN